LVPPDDDKSFIAASCSLAWQYRHLDGLREHARAAALKARWSEVLGSFETELADTLSVHMQAACDAPCIA
ncbi:MAG TPA: hypothetical protein VKI18_14880, partial [Albitalea sp.]|nr:hypothetical protein [Albitalea sp.]